jgi:riboflavin kinase/FMN adenylyltransferase
MKVYRSLDTYEKGGRTVATIGTFDGLHIGHKTILDRLKNSAHALEAEAVLISFHPHPRLVLFPDNNPLRLLHTLEEKIAMLDAIGINKLLLIPFTRDFSRIPSRAFVQDILVDKIGITRLVIGYDHHFGKNRTGNIEELEEMSKEFGYEVEEIPAQAIDNANVSSTKIRQALLSGDIETARAYLGYDYSFAGTVVHGAKKGRSFGYPTANIRPDDTRKLIPGDGVYFVKVHTAGHSYYGMLSIGTKPTLGEYDRTAEVNIFNFDQDIYGKPIRVDMLAFLRGQEKFVSTAELIEAMGRDKRRCEEMMMKRL